MVETVSFSVDDIVVLMAAAREHGVSEFFGGGLKFSLVNDPIIRAKHMQYTPTEKPNKQEKDLDLLLIEDPKAFEEAMREID